jgi:hypothetical protein
MFNRIAKIGKIFYTNFKNYCYNRKVYLGASRRAPTDRSSDIVGARRLAPQMSASLIKNGK